MCIYILSALDGGDFATLGSGLENLIPRNGIPDTLPDYDERMIQLLQMSCSREVNREKNVQFSRGRRTTKLLLNGAL